MKFIIKFNRVIANKKKYVFFSSTFSNMYFLAVFSVISSDAKKDLTQ